MAIGLKAVTVRLGYQQLTSLASATGLTVPRTDVSGLSVRPRIAIIVVEGAAVRWRDDGVDPTSSVGMPLAVGVSLQYDGDLTAIKFIQQSPAAAVNISYYA